MVNFMIIAVFILTDTHNQHSLNSSCAAVEKNSIIFPDLQPSQTCAVKAKLLERSQPGKNVVHLGPSCSGWCFDLEPTG